tara:strand:- start:2156 stop:2623 length:468 start_codon:yes stop_codon:yes gene_type:complete
MYFLRQLKGSEIDRLMRHQVNIFDQMDRMFSNSNFTRSLSESYPPHNIRKKDNTYLIEMAVAGFDKSDIKISREKEHLLVEGSKEVKEEDTLLYQGIAGRSFKKSFALSDNIKVLGADLRDGMLFIGLEEMIPEAEQPQTIEIGNQSMVIDNFIS